MFFSIEESITKQLSDKEACFCAEYINDRNPRKAVMRCGIPSYRAKKEAALLMARLNVRSRIEQLIAEAEERTRQSTEELSYKVKQLSNGKYI